jgi:SNF2 family DNA or RNA helicase
LRAVLARETPPDSKFERLFSALTEIWGDDVKHRRPPRKVILFSFFKRTLRWLEEQLRGHDVGLVRIDGDVPLYDREERIRNFLDRPELLVLLSSEVGGEGLDLQAASVVVNYDLPWNPAVVEQRIGRVDRIGQAASRLVIVNLVCENTVEDRILHRLYERIHLFEASIGEMEEILGSAQVQSLVADWLRGDLSERELAARVDQTA